MSLFTAMKCPNFPNFFSIIIKKTYSLRVELSILNNRKNLGKVGTESESFTARKRCFDCRFWVGRCLKGRKNVIAMSEACELFEPKTDSYQFQISIEYQPRNVLKVKQKYRLQGRLTEVSKMAESRLLSARLPSISSLEPLERVGEWL